MDVLGLQKDEEPPPSKVVGGTLFTHARNLESLLGFGNIYLKFEGSNPTGTQKDRISQYHVHKAMREGYDTVTVGTCGNYGVSLAYFANLVGLKAKILIPEKYTMTPRRRETLNSLGAEILSDYDKYEDAVEASRRLAKTEHYYDANPGNGNEGWRGYMSIATEIYAQLGNCPTAVAAPGRQRHHSRRHLPRLQTPPRPRENRSHPLSRRRLHSRRQPDRPQFQDRSLQDRGPPSRRAP